MKGVNRKMYFNRVASSCSLGHCVLHSVNTTHVNIDVCSLRTYDIMIMKLVTPSDTFMPPFFNFFLFFF